MKHKRREKKLKQMNDKYNRHHLINVSRWWTSVEENIRKTKVNLHNCLHAIFWNETPAEAIKSLLDYFSDVFTEAFRQDLYRVLSNHKGVEHDPKCYKGNSVRWWGIKDLLAKWTKNG